MVGPKAGRNDRAGGTQDLCGRHAGERRRVGSWSGVGKLHASTLVADLFVILPRGATLPQNPEPRPPLRLMLTETIPVERGNAAAKDGTIGKAIGDLVQEDPSGNLVELFQPASAAHGAR